MRLISLGFLATLLAMAQIQEIAATADGGEILIATSFRPANIADPVPGTWQRILRGGRGEWRTVASATDGFTIAGSFAELLLSADGRIFGYRSFPGCILRCMFVYPKREVYGVDLKDPLTQVESLALSANGSYLLIAGQEQGSGRRVIRRYDVRGGGYVDLFRGERPGLAIPGLLDEGRFAVTNAGEALLFENARLFLLEAADGRRTELLANRDVASAWITGEGTRVIYEVRGRTREFRVFERRTGIDRSLFEIPLEPFWPVAITISSDERRLVYSRAGEAKLVEIASGEARDLGAVTRSSGRVALLTTDGETVIAVRPDQRVERLRIASDEWETVVPAFGDAELDGGGWRGDRSGD